MKKRIIRVILLFTCLQLNAQDYYAQLQNEAYELGNKGKFAESLQLTSKILKVYPAILDANIQHSYNLINLGRAKDAAPFIRIGLSIDPTNSSLHYDMAYWLAADDKPEEAKKYFVEAIKLGPADLDVTLVVNEIKAIGNKLSKTETFNRLADWFVQTYPTIKERRLTLTQIWDTFTSLSSTPEKLKQDAAKTVSGFIALNQQDLALLTWHYASSAFQNAGMASEAIEMEEAAYAHYKTKGFGNNHLVAGMILANLMDLYLNKGDNERVSRYLDEAMQHSGKAPISTYEFRALMKASESYGTRHGSDFEKYKKTAATLAFQAFSVAEKTGNIADMALAYNALCVAYQSGMDAQSNAIGLRYGEMGLKLAEEYQLPSKESLLPNLALCYWASGREGQLKCLDMYRGLIDRAKKESQWSSASLYLNNLGSMYWLAQRYEEAAQYFEESVALAQYDNKYNNPKDRLTYYQGQLSAYGFLVMCYARLGNAEKAFQAMEGSRARVLSERLSPNKRATTTLADLQNLLKPDEACIMYSLVSGFEVVILTVTKKYAQVIYHEDPRFVGDIKDKYLNKGAANEIALADTRQSNQHEWISLRSQSQVARDNYDRGSVAPKSDFNRVTEQTRRFFERPGMANEVLLDYLYRYQKFLIVPVLNRLSGIKNLLISPDDVLNFIPFEALRSFDGKYLVEKYNVRYMHSASILAQLQERNYSETRKPLFAMGGAIYEDLETEGMALNSTADFNLLETEVYDNLKTGKSQRKAYASLFGQRAMNPLPGTMEEVKNISKNLPGSEIFMGADMTENRIKTLSKNGQLKNYKVLHLATHGFVVNELPDLSGVAMSIFKKEQDGEDGFLNATEIANLNLNADLTVLSACQTAQGKIYVGEGVTGLTQSLILAGSNAALVSLWPVNDASTMLFMSNFYKEVAKGKPYSIIVNDLKKKFIKGDFGKEFQHPNFWAPFIYYGK